MSSDAHDPDVTGGRAIRHRTLVHGSLDSPGTPAGLLITAIVVSNEQERIMFPYCTDIDLLHWEPNLLGEAAFVSQTLMSGLADLAGTALSIASGSFAEAHVVAGQVVHLAGDINGSFPIVSVNSATELTISVLHDQLFPNDGEPAPAPVGSASDVPFVIRTYWPQRQVISELLQQVAGIIPGDPSMADAVILNPQTLRRPAILGTLQLIYSALAALEDAPAEYSRRSTLYERLYRQSMRATEVLLDVNNDGRAEIRRQLNVTELIRR